ncbi:hypothetical protein V5O48_015657 [Marasmius crinis-equi]|uniref:Uncharacterized protein n=1 Tax=Marasmius crinis-equi TaxID=585013 RepID=A0ABR3EU08_9AGAR
MAGSKHSSVVATDDQKELESTATPSTTIRRECTKGINPSNQLSTKRNTRPTEKAAGQAAEGSGKWKAEEDGDAHLKKKKKKRAVEEASGDGEEDNPIVLEDAGDISNPTIKKSSIATYKGATEKDNFFKTLHVADQIKEWKASDKTTTYLHFNEQDRDCSPQEERRWSCTVLILLQNYVTRVRYNTSASNLGKHIKACTGKLAEPTQRIEQYAAAGVYNKGLFCLKTVYWVTHANCKDSIESPSSRWSNIE